MLTPEEQVALLNKSVPEWNEARKDGTIRWPSLRDADLTRTDLRDANLVDASLTDTNLRGSDLANANLRGADLSFANLSFASMEKANLEKANLDSAYLYSAYLAHAKLRGVDLSSTRLRRTNLANADLANADLTNADLKGADLSNADLTGANLGEADLIDTTLHATKFSSSRLRDTSFVTVDLRTAIGLESVKHLGPSSIGIDTLFASGGEIPEVFLRGAGVPENLIAYHQSLAAPSAIEFYSCFISYSHEDKSFAQRLHDQLQSRGIRCWLDEKDATIGGDILAMVTGAIRLHDRVILCCSQKALTSTWVEVELEEALEKEEEQGRNILLPLQLDDFMFNGWKGPKAVEVRKRLAADFKGWESGNSIFEEQFERIVRALKHEPEPGQVDE